MDERPQEQALFKVSDVARLMDVTVQTVHFWIRTRRLTVVGRASSRGPYLIRRRDVVALLKGAGREVPGLWHRFRLRCLVIEPNEALRRLIRDSVRGSSPSVDLKLAATSEDGLLLAGERTPHVILLARSFSHSGIEGDEALRFIRKAEKLKRVKVIALVGDRRSADVMSRAGADAILRKPFGIRELRDALNLVRSRPGAKRSSIR